jgi:gliding motility-associated lipoprotein GldH
MIEKPIKRRKKSTPMYQTTPKAMKNLLKNSILLLVVTVLPVACTDDVVYHSYRYISKKGWNREDTLTFDIQVPDSTPTQYCLYAQVRNRTDYPYQSLLLSVSHNLQDSSVVVTDTVRCILANALGRWTGEGWGSLFQATSKIGEYTSVNPAGMRTVKLIHWMEDETLTGINDIGIQIKR